LMYPSDMTFISSFPLRPSNRGGNDTMNKQVLIDAAIRFTRSSEENIISDPVALSESVKGLVIFDDPIFSFARADDDLFSTLKKPSVIGEHFLLPHEWLEGAKTVISFFLPFSEAVRTSNSRESTWPSDGWLHGRIEGQAFLKSMCLKLQDDLAEAGFRSIIPLTDSRFRSRSGPGKTRDEAGKGGQGIPYYTSNWSERHIAWVCGLGSFGLSRGLVTSKGVAGRFGSLVTDLQVEPDGERHESFLSFCSSCGSCIKNCPVNAISFEHGKDQDICSKFQDEIKEKFKPRYGCGKCQVGVPCEKNMPGRRGKI
jgi:epoxyqueuosine reductase QueG